MALRAMLFSPPAGSSPEEVIAAMRALFRSEGRKWLAEWAVQERHEDGQRRER